ncbi:hypothetical protein NQ318_023087 [Aromia moschata]|uniref:Uncharacterized protein n=1 Tax=Aromia moschata TaxID=1265417 RepID=A0AAV8XL73_9CUCU|nr:hypothetical protein NQ318_023087 [Aromia moschata]
MANFFYTLDALQTSLKSKTIFIVAETEYNYTKYCPPTQLPPNIECPHMSVATIYGCIEQ